MAGKGKWLSHSRSPGTAIKTHKADQKNIESRSSLKSGRNMHTRGRAVLKKKNLYTESLMIRRSLLLYSPEKGENSE